MRISDWSSDVCSSDLVSLLGSGRIAVGGAAEKLTAAISGSGDFDARAPTVEQAEVNADTAGTIAVTVTETVEVKATRSGDKTIQGSPDFDDSARGTRFGRAHV